jgi:hypothetical protein
VVIPEACRRFKDAEARYSERCCIGFDHAECSVFSRIIWTDFSTLSVVEISSEDFECSLATNAQHLLSKD